MKRHLIALLAWVKESAFAFDCDGSVTIGAVRAKASGKSRLVVLLACLLLTGSGPAAEAITDNSCNGYMVSCLIFCNAWEAMGGGGGGSYACAVGCMEGLWNCVFGNNSAAGMAYAPRFEISTPYAFTNGSEIIVYPQGSSSITLGAGRYNGNAFLQSPGSVTNVTFYAAQLGATTNTLVSQLPWVLIGAGVYNSSNGFWEVPWNLSQFTSPGGYLLAAVFADPATPTNAILEAFDLASPWTSPPLLTQDLASQTVIQGQTATMTVAAIEGPFAFQWQSGPSGSGVFNNLSDGGQISGSASANLSISAVTPANAADYRVVIANAYGSSTSSVATLTVVSSYSINLQAGYSLIANQLDHGSNTLTEIMPSAPDGSVLWKYNNGGSNWSPSVYSAAYGGWTPGNLTLNPGEGAFFQAPTNFTLTITGTPHVPVLPVSIPSGACYLLSRQTNDVGNYTNIVGLPPVNGSIIYKFASVGYNAFGYSARSGGWVPSEPTAAVGEAVWIAPTGGAGPAPFPTNIVVFFQGLLNESLGAATLSVNSASNRLVISNLGSSGQDGVSITMPTNLTRFEVDYQPLDDSDTLPIGAYLQSQTVGAGSTGSSVLATETVTKAGASNYTISADYSALGVSTYTVQAFLHGVLQAQVSGQPGSSLATANIFPKGKDVGDIITPLSDEWGGQSAVLTIGAGTSVPCDHLLISPENLTSDVVPTAFQIVASQIPSITITGENESLVYQGLTNTSLGHATMVVSGHRLQVSNLGSSGQDGVSIAIPGDYGTNLTRLTVAYQPLDPSNALPIGSYVQEQAVGTVNSITNGLLATVTVAKQCAVCGGSNWLVSADYSALGVSNFTVQAYLQGVLVAQASNRSASSLAVVEKPPSGDDVGDYTLPESLEWPGTNVLCIINGTQNVICDHVVLSAQYPTDTIVQRLLDTAAQRSFQIVCSGVPNLDITSENASLVFQGLTNTSLGNASLAVSGGQLAVANLGSSGQDGVSVAWPPNTVGMTLSCPPSDGTNTLVDGAYFQDQLVGTVKGITNGILGTVTVTKYAPTNYSVSADYSALGASTYTVQAFFNGIVVGQASHLAGSSLAVANCGPGTLDLIIASASSIHWPTNALLTFGGISGVLCDHIEITPENVLFPDPPTAFQVVASQVPGFTIATETASFVYQGLTNTSLGHASVTEAGGNLVVSNLGSSGQDGVAITLPGGLTALDAVWEPFDESNTVPVGAYIQEQIVGTAGTITNGVLGTVTMTKQCAVCGGSNYVISADFSAIGASTYTVQAYAGGTLVAQATGQPGASLASAPYWGDSGCIPHPPFHGGGLDWTNVLLSVGGASVQCDHLFVIPEGVPSSSPSTAIQFTASGIPALTFSDENANFSSLVYQGLTNVGLGNAILAISSTDLVVSNLSSSGQDGVAVSLLPGYSFAGSWLPLDPADALPIGAYVQTELIGTAGGITDGLLGSTTCTKEGTSNYIITVDYSPLGSVAHTIQVYNGNILVAQVTGQSGSLVATTKLPPGTCTINPMLNQEWPDPTYIAINGGPTVTGTEILMIPEGAAEISSVSAAQILAANIPSITITSEVETLGESVNLVYQGLTNTGLGYATMVLWPAVSTNELVISNLGSSGQDGVTVALPTNSTALTLEWLPLDPGNTLPVGAYLQEHIIGTANGTVNTVLGTITVRKAGPGDFPITADFSTIGASTYTAQAYLHGIMVAQATNLSGASLAVANSWPYSADTEGGIPVCTGSVDWGTNETTVYLGNSSVAITCDHLFITPENVSLSSAPSALQLTASQVPSITISSENESLVYQGLTNTSLGAASLAVSGSELVVSNLGSSGQDGVSVSLPSNLTALVMSCPPSDGTNNLPFGAYFQSQLVGTGNGINNAVLGTLTVTKESNTNYQVTADYSPIGASTRTVQAFLNGVLVAQVTGQSGPVVASASASPDTFDLGGIEPGSVGWKYTNFNVLTIAGGPTVQCDHLIVAPENVSVAVAPAAFQIVASHVPMFTLETENESLVYQGLTNTSIHHASLTVSGSQLVVSNLSSTGQDGVSIALPGNTGTNLTTLAVTYLPLDTSNTLPVGAYLQMSDVGTGGSVSNGVLGSVTVTKVGTANYAVTANYPSSATNTFTVSVYNGANLAASVAGVSGMLCTSSQMGQDTEDPENGTPGSARRTYPPGTTFALTGGPTVTGDALTVAPGDLLSTVFSVSSVQLLASGISSIIITNESGTQGEIANFVYQGLTNRSLGHATVAVSGSQLVVSNLGSSGQDGLAIALPGNAAGFDVNWQPLDPLNALPVGAFLREDIMGTAGGIIDGLLGTLTMTKQCGTCATNNPNNFVVSADFSPAGASTYTVQAYRDGVLAAQATGQSGAAVAYCSSWAESGNLPPKQPPPFEGGWDWPPDGGLVTIAGATNVVCDHLEVIPENVSGTPTTLEFVASQIPVITITSENESLVYQGLTNTSLGHATVAASGTNLVITNLGSSGQDGVSIAWPSNLMTLDVHGQQFDGSNTLPVGAYIREQAIGTANGITNGVLSTLTVTKAGTSNYAYTADFTPLGTSNCLVQAYLQGVLVGQVTNNGGAGGEGIIIIDSNDGPNSWDHDTTDGSCTTDFIYMPLPSDTTQVTLAGGPTVTCDHLFITPLNSPTYTPSAFQLTASQVPTISINTENASFVYQGLTNASLGHATLAVSGNDLYITNLGSSGQDGVTIALPAGLPGFDMTTLPVDPSNSLPVGAYIQEGIIGTANGITNGLTGTVTVTKAGTSNYVVSANFSAIGASAYLVQAALHGLMVAQVTNNGGSSLGQCEVMVDSHDTFTNTDGTTYGSLDNKVPCNIALTGGPTVTCDQLFITPLNTPSYRATGYQLTASQIPALTIFSEVASQGPPAPPGFVYQGLTNTSLGHATVAVSGSQLVVSNLGSSGQDGVSIAVPGNIAGFDVNWQPLDPLNALPVGAFLREDIIGTAGGIINGLLGTLTMTKQCGTCATNNPNNFVVSADFSPAGASTYTVQAYRDGVLAAQATGQSGAAVAYCSSWAESGNLPPKQPPPFEGGWDWPPDGGLVTIAGATNVVCDHLEVIPENVSGTPTTLEFVASQIPVITITGENESLVYQGLTNTSLGHATVAASGTNLVITNLGSSGQDGLSISWPSNLSALDVHFENVDPSNTLPIGAYYTERTVGTANGIINGTLGSVTVTKANATNYSVTADFSPLGTSNCLVQAYLSGQLVGQVTNSGGPGGIIILWPFGPVSVDLDMPLEVRSPSLTLDAGIPFPFSIVGGPTVTCDQVFITPLGASIYTPSAFQLTASQIPAITIDTENASLYYQGLLHTSTGDASLSVESNLLTVANLGLSGQDGVEIDMGSSNDFTLSVLSQPLAGAGTITISGLGYINGQPGRLACQNHIVSDGTNYTFSFDFSAVGASGYTFQIFNGTTLVYQSQGNSNGAPAGVIDGPPFTFTLLPPDTTTVPRIPLPPDPPLAQLHFPLISYSPPGNGTNGGKGLAADTMLAFPENATTTVQAISNVRIQASGGIPQLVLAAEYLNDAHVSATALGNARFVPEGSSLTLANLGTNGRDGVSLALPENLTGLATTWDSLDPSNALPVGAYVESQMIGNAGSVSNGVLGSVICTKEGTSNYVISVDYSPLGASTHTLQVYNGGTLVGQLTGQAGAVCAATKLPPGTCTINPFLNEEWPIPTAITLNGGPTYTGTELLMLPEGGAPLGSLTAEQILTAEIPSLTIVTQTVLTAIYGGLQQSPLGNATLTLLNDSLTISNLGNGGQDGVSMTLPQGNVGVAAHWLSLDPGNTLPIGAYVLQQMYGNSAGVSNGLLGWVQVTKAGTSNYAVTASFPSAASSQCLVQVYNGSTLVASATNANTGPLCILPRLPFDIDTGTGPTFPVPDEGGGGCVGGLTWHNGTGPISILLNGAMVQGDMVLISSLSAPPVSAMTGLNVLASGIPQIVITNETATAAYAGISHTSQGNAALSVQASNNSTTITVSNLGTAGQNGVMIDFPGGLTSWGADWRDPDLNGKAPVGAYIRESVIGSGGSVTNGVVGTVTTTKLGTSNYTMTADFSPMGASTFDVVVYNGSTLVTSVSGLPNGTPITRPDITLSVHIYLRPLRVTGDGSIGPINIDPDGLDDAAIGNYVVFTPGGTNQASATGIIIQGAQVSSIAITNESVAPVLLNTKVSTGSLQFQWLGSGVLQQSPNLASWADSTNIVSPVTVPIGRTNQFYRVRQPVLDQPF